MNRHPFDLLMELESDQIRLDCAALHLARDAYPHLDLNAYLTRLDIIAEEVAAKRPGISATARYAAMREVLVEDYELKGNNESYYDPDNSYVNRVLDRRVGIPISLATIWIEVGRRLMWPVAGVSFPGHFLVRFDDPEQYVLADVFNAGQSLSLDDCRKMLDFRFEGQIEFSQKFLEPVDNRTIVARMLNNLRSIFLSNGDWRRLEPVLRRLAAVEPTNGQHLQELAALHCRQGDVKTAYGYLSLYLERLPNADDHAMVRRNLAQLRAAMLALN